MDGKPWQLPQCSLIGSLTLFITMSSTGPITAMLAGAVFAVPANFLVVVSVLLGLHTGSCCHRRVVKHQGG